MTQENTWLPNDYQKPPTNSNYMKFEQGDNKFRILSNPIVGFEYWTNDNKPVRSKQYPTETPNIKTDKEGKSRVNHFWAFIVWGYRENKLMILQITQNSIKDYVEALQRSDNWGNPNNYDLNVSRKGTGFDTEYQTMALPPAQLSENIDEAYKKANIDLNALYDGGDPFNSEQEQVKQAFEEADTAPPVMADMVAEDYTKDTDLTPTDIPYISPVMNENLPPQEEEQIKVENIPF